MHQRFGHHGAAAKFARFGLHLLANRVHPRLMVGNHISAFQHIFVGESVRNHHAFGMMHAMAENFVVGSHAEPGKIPDFIIGEHHQRQHRTHERLLVIAPAHALGNGQLAHHPLEHARQQRFQRLPDLIAVIHQPLAFGRIFH